MEESFIDYGRLIDGAMRSIVRDALKIVQKEGLAGDHHFYITFYTEFPGVVISSELKKEYKEEMTIVLQHQFWELAVEKDFFTVVLSFNHKKQKLIIPFDAITAFADPSVKFGLQFRQMEEEIAEATSDNKAGTPPVKKPIKAIAAKVDVDDGEKPIVGSNNNVISLDNFRKK